MLNKMTIFMTFSEWVKNVYRGTGVGTRVISGVVAVAIMVGFSTLLAMNSISGQKEDYVEMLDGRQFSNAEMANCEAAFGKNGLSNYKWSDGKLRVPVSDRGKFATAIYVENCVSNIGDNDIHAEGGIGIFELKMRQAAARDLSELIGKFPGIERVSVLVNCRIDRDLKFNDKTYAYSATVNVWPMKEEYLSEELLVSITKATRNSLGIDDLDDISIVNGKLAQISKGVLPEGMKIEKTPSLPKIAAELIESMPEVETAKIVLKQNISEIPDEDGSCFSYSANVIVWPGNKWYMNHELLVEITAIIKENLKIPRWTKY